MDRAEGMGTPAAPFRPALLLGFLVALPFWQVLVVGEAKESLLGSPEEPAQELLSCRQVQDGSGVVCEDGNQYILSHAADTNSLTLLGAAARTARKMKKQAGDPDSSACPDASSSPPEAPIGSEEFDFNLGMAVLCVVCAALAAGLTMGMVSLEPLDMELLITQDPEDLETEQQREDLKREKAYAQRVLPLIQDHHLLLVTLLLMNSIANEALPIFLDGLVPSWAAVLISVSVVLFFGEIIPSAVFTGPKQLQLAARLSPVVRVCQVLLYVLARPIAWCLDRFLGAEHKGRYNKAELKALMHLHLQAQIEGDDFRATTATVEPEDSMDASGKKSSASLSRADTKGSSHGEGGPLSQDEVLIMFGALELSKRTVEEVMTPLDKVEMLSSEDVLDMDKMSSMLALEHSRIPVYHDNNPHNIRGLLMVKTLLVVNPEDKRRVGSLGLRAPVVVPPTFALQEMLNVFQTGKSHMALIASDPDAVRQAWRSGEPIPPNVHVAGIVTMEDVIEVLLEEEIADESDAKRHLVSNLGQIAFKAKRVNRLQELAAEARKLAVIKQRRLTVRGSQKGSKEASGAGGFMKSAGKVPLLADDKLVGA